MFIEALIIGIIVGLIKRGKISRLAYVNFNLKFLIYMSAIFYLGIVVMNLGLYSFNSVLYSVFLVLIYLSAAGFIIANISQRFMFIPLLGLIFNLIVLFANKLKFPVSVQAAEKIYGSEMIRLLYAGKYRFFIPDSSASLRFLGNVISLANLCIVSIGDIIIAIGIILMVQDIVSDKFIKNRSSITFSKGIFK
jgi:hypothetical protein